ncbi:MAG: TIR domain-containing protein [Chloroflexi bacterium]|nr:TIR domain-containing protein [Chloroflexota bacterium]
MSRIFINYRRQDSEGYVGRVYDHLLQHFQRDDVFMDVDTIQPGADFVQVLEDAVKACDVFIAVIGPQWLTIRNQAGERRLDQWNDFVRIEIATALAQDKLVIPVLVGEADMPPPQELPEDLAPLSRRNAFELSHRRFSYDMERLVEVIKREIPAHPSFKPRADDETYQRKEEDIRQLRLELVDATDSPLFQFRDDNRLFPVLGEGNADANIMFIGEAPGKNEAEIGRPFCGPSGDVLDEMLASIDLAREGVFLTNLVLDRPPEKRNPTPEEIAYYTPFVDRLIDIIQPAVIVTLGSFAMGYVLRKLDLPEKRGKISQLHGKLIKAELDYGEIHVVPLYHPAVVLYNPSKKDVLLRDFQKLKLFV